MALRYVNIRPKQKPDPSNERACVYRHFAKSGELLYVGCTRNPVDRLAEHKGQKRQWIESISTITVEWFDSRREAQEAETKAIAIESPMFNTRSGIKGEQSSTIAQLPVSERKRAENGTFDRKTYMREYMRKRREGKRLND